MSSVSTIRNFYFHIFSHKYAWTHRSNQAGDTLPPRKTCEDGPSTDQNIAREEREIGVNVAYLPGGGTAALGIEGRRCVVNQPVHGDVGVVEQ